MTLKQEGPQCKPTSMFTSGQIKRSDRFHESLTIFGSETLNPEYTLPRVQQCFLMRAIFGFRGNQRIDDLTMALFLHSIIIALSMGNLPSDLSVS